MDETPWLDAGGVAVRLRVLARARRLTLRLDPEGAGAILTLPPGVTRPEAGAFLVRHSDWLRAAVRAQPQRCLVEPGSDLPVGGRLHRIVTGPRGLRAPRLAGDHVEVPCHRSAGASLAAWLKHRARGAIAPEAERQAARLGKSIAAIAFRDTRSRWGSCSSSRRLSFSWRLAMAPPEIQAYVAAHEAAHLVEMNHSARYWAVLERLMPDYRRHRDWLRREGRELHRYRFEGAGETPP